MAKLVIWTWTEWMNQQTNAHQKRPYKPRKLFWPRGVAMQGEVRVTERTSERTSRPSQSHHQIHPPSCYSHVHYIHKAFSIKVGSDKLTMIKCRELIAFNIT